MQTHKFTATRFFLSWHGMAWQCAIAGCLTLASCGSQVTDTGTETHWLISCDSDIECGDGLECLCGVCSIACSSSNACPNEAPRCISTGDVECNESSAAKLCLGQDGVLPLASGADAATTPDASTTVSPGADASPPTPPPLSFEEERPIEPVTSCDADGWCWEPTAAPGEPFTALSQDGRFAVGRGGVVFETPNHYHAQFTTEDLLTVSTFEETVWVGGYGGLWSYDGTTWTQLSEDTVTALSVTPTGQLWGIRNDAVARWEDDDWVDMELPAGDFVQDIVALSEDRVWVLAVYLYGREGGKASVFEWTEGGWQENPSGIDLNYSARFLRGSGTPYVFGLTTFEQPRKLEVLDPAQAWVKLAEAPADGPELAFWGPGGELWGSRTEGIFAFADPTATIAEAPCTAAATWDPTTIQCAQRDGGLTYISKAGTSGYSMLPDATPPLPSAQVFGEVPTPVWAAADVAWGISDSDVWRAPLEHYDGSTWTDWREADDVFSAEQMDGTASDNVWFIGQGELRHWDGDRVESIVFESDAAELSVKSVRSFGPSDTWALVYPDGEETEVRRFDGESWTKLHTLGSYKGALLGSGPNDVWAIARDFVTHFDGSNWTQVVAPGLDTSLSGGAYDDGDLWVVSDLAIYQLEGSELVRRSQQLGSEHLALTPERVWSYSAGRVRWRAR